MGLPLKCLFTETELKANSFLSFFFFFPTQILLFLLLPVSDEGTPHFEASLVRSGRTQNQPQLNTDLPLKRLNFSPSLHPTGPPGTCLWHQGLLGAAREGKGSILHWWGFDLCLWMLHSAAQVALCAWAGLKAPD